MSFEAPLSISCRSSGVSSIAAAVMFSSKRDNLVVPGIGTIHAFRASSQRVLSDGESPASVRQASQAGQQRRVRFPSLWHKARNDVAEVGTVERSVFVDLSRQEALAQGAIGNEPNSKFFDRRQHHLLRISEPGRVFALDRGHRLDGVSSPNRLCSSFRKAECFTLPSRIRFPTAPATSSIGTFGSTRC